MSSDLFNDTTGKPAPSSAAASSVSAPGEYTADTIEVLEGLEPVRRRPGMYIGGTDEQAMHHLVNEVLDNAMDEAVAGHATRIEVELAADQTVTIHDNGRGIPIDPHPKFPDKSALEVILTTLHAGGKFSDKLYATSGGLHGVGISVVNALSDRLTAEIARNQTLYRQQYSRGEPLGPIETVGRIANRRGTTVIFHPDAEIFGAEARFRPARLYRIARSKAYLFRGVEICWQCDPALISEKDTTPAKERIHFPGGLGDFLAALTDGQEIVTPTPFTGETNLPDKQGRVEWAVSWQHFADAQSHSYCNTIPTPEGGTHEQGMRAALLKGLRAFAELSGQKKLAGQLTGEDMGGGLCLLLSAFIRDPQFQGQTKEKLVSRDLARLVETAVRDHVDHWLSGHTDQSQALLAALQLRVDERLQRRQARDAIKRQSATQRLRLPGKLADCSRQDREGTELFLVEGDSAGGSAKQARRRDSQAILPLRGKILNVASATADKIRANQGISDLTLALGCGTRGHYRSEDLRYERVIIMTDADVDGAHIASLLMTFFYREMPGLIRGGHLYLACPPLYRITLGTESHYAMDEPERNAIMEKLAKKKGKVNTTRFKGLGEMTPPQLKETTMNPDTRRLLQVTIADAEAAETSLQVDNLMGRHPEKRFQFITEEIARRHGAMDELLDV